jgi:hypothetical protein
MHCGAKRLGDGVQRCVQRVVKRCGATLEAVDDPAKVVGSAMPVARPSIFRKRSERSMNTLRTRTIRLATTALLTLGAVGAALAAGAAPASALVRPNYYHCNNNGSGTCTTLNSGGAEFYYHNGSPGYWISGGTGVEVTCWYLSNGAYEDHLTYVWGRGNVDGHVSDSAVNFGGLTPPQVGIPQC